MDVAVPFPLLRTLRACLDGTVDQPELERAREELDALLLSEPDSEGWVDELPAASPVMSAAQAAHWINELQPDVGSDRLGVRDA